MKGRSELPSGALPAQKGRSEEWRDHGIEDKCVSQENIFFNRESRTRKCAVVLTDGRDFIPLLLPFSLSSFIRLSPPHQGTNNTRNVANHTVYGSVREHSFPRVGFSRRTLFI